MYNFSVILFIESYMKFIKSFDYVVALGGWLYE